MTLSELAARGIDLLPPDLSSILEINRLGSDPYIKFALDHLFMCSLAPSSPEPIMSTRLCQSISTIVDLVQWKIRPQTSTSPFEVYMGNDPLFPHIYYYDRNGEYTLFLIGHTHNEEFDIIRKIDKQKVSIGCRMWRTADGFWYLN